MILIHYRHRLTDRQSTCSGQGSDPTFSPGRTWMSSGTFLVVDDRCPGSWVAGGGRPLTGREITGVPPCCRKLRTPSATMPVLGYAEKMCGLRIRVIVDSDLQHPQMHDCGLIIVIVAPFQCLLPITSRVAYHSIS